jgi:hypothetical protein
MKFIKNRHTEHILFTSAGLYRMFKLADTAKKRGELDPFTVNTLTYAFNQIEEEPTRKLLQDAFPELFTGNIPISPTVPIINNIPKND